MLLSNNILLNLDNNSNYYKKRVQAFAVDCLTKGVNPGLAKSGLTF